MAKQRHNQPQPESASRAPLAMMAVGALLVAGLIVWALTRTVEPSPSVSSTISPSSDTSATLVPPIDSTTSVVPPTNTVTSNTAPPPPTADITTSPQTVPAIAGNKSEVPRIAAEDLREKTKANAVVVIDTRDATSYASGHIPGALHIPMASVEANLDRIPKDREIVTYCT
jgi:hypothetical protein